MTYDQELERVAAFAGIEVTPDMRINRHTYVEPGCVSCTETMGPRHMASDACESGKRPHCSCDECF